jgi:hypothetical protein
MTRYSQTDSDIFSVFGSEEWEDEEIPTFPSNMSFDKVPRKFILLSIIKSGAGVNLKSISGQLIIDIFIAAGEGPTQASNIADTLDTFLVGKTLNKTQFFESSMTELGKDKANPTLYRTQYVIPFQHFEAL